MEKYGYDDYDRTNILYSIILFTLHNEDIWYCTYLRELSPDQTKWLAIKDPTRSCLDSDHCQVIKTCCDFVVRIVQNPKLAHLEGNPFHTASQKMKHCMKHAYIHSIKGSIIYVPQLHPIAVNHIKAMFGLME